MDPTTSMSEPKDNLDPLQPEPQPDADGGREGAEIFEIAGSIKWFDASKGYGFIVPDAAGLADVILTTARLIPLGRTSIQEAARIHCQVMRMPKGMQVLRIISIDDSTAIDPAKLPSRAHTAITDVGAWERAIVLWFNRVRGFGFLGQGEGKEQIFVHMETVRRSGFDTLNPGQEVDVRWGYGLKGRMASELRAGVTGTAPPFRMEREERVAVRPLVTRWHASAAGLDRLAIAVIEVLGADAAARERLRSRLLPILPAEARQAVLRSAPGAETDTTND